MNALTRLDTQVRWMLAGLLLVAVAVSAYLFGVHTSTPSPEVITPAAAQSQADGSVILARSPATTTETQAKQTIPKGATVERVITATVKPRARLKLPDCSSASEPVPRQSTQCPPVQLDLSMIREGDQRRVIASSPDGEIVAGLDVPVEAGLIPVSHPWSAGISYGSHRTPGLFLERDLGRLRVGAEAIREDTGSVQARLRLGWNW